MTIFKCIQYIYVLHGDGMSGTNLIKPQIAKKYNASSNIEQCQIRYVHSSLDIIIRKIPPHPVLASCLSVGESAVDTIAQSYHIQINTIIFPDSLNALYN